VRVDEHTISLDNSPAYYRRADRSGMPTLYLHGIPTSSDDWVEFLARTGGIAPDLIGFGRSGKGGHLDYSLAGLAGFVERLLEHLGVQEVQVVGHDWGAAVALTLADRNAGRVRRLVLCNPPPASHHEWPRILNWWRARGLGELVMGAIPKRLLARELRRGSVRSDAWPDARIAAVWDQFDQGTQRAILRLVRSAGDDVIGGGGPRSPGGGGAANDDVIGGRPRPPGGGEAVPPRALILWGEEDPWYPPAVADAYAARLPGATVERIAGAGHWPWLDRPEVVDHVASLLAG
jgi:pimeloyl-ACP methyl ester carboxylesterase